MATILVVDDLAANRQVLVALLRYEGHRLLEAEDGQQGLAVVQAEHPDLVITDVLMPVMDGYEFVRKLRLHAATRTIPVVFYTAHYGEREARAFALSSGVAFVLTKPVEPDDVLNIVVRALAGETETGVPPAASPLTSAFDREHLRLLTDQLSVKAEDLRTANGRLRALINIGLELASERDARDAGHRRSERPEAAAFRYRWNGRCELDRGRRRRPWSPADGSHRATDAAWRQCRWRPGDLAAPLAPSGSSRIPDGTHRVTDPGLRLDLPGRQ